MTHSERGAAWWHREGEDARCLLCPHECLLAPGARGRCGARVHVPGRGLTAATYGLISSLAIDPVEKKPLYHWNPGTLTLSLGSVGCSMDCPFCQNWRIARPRTIEDIPVRYLGPEEPGRLAEEEGVPSVSFTYNEPLVSWEYLVDASRILKERDIPAIVVSNGLISEPPLKELAPLIAAANIDLKAYGEKRYRMLGGRLGTVRRTIVLLIEAGVHVEVTFLLVPGLNDEMTPFLEMVQWLSELSPQPVLHISRYFPNRRWTEGATPETLMAEYVRRASERLAYVYAGNGGDENSTLCRRCGELLVHRQGFRVIAMNVDRAGHCMRCGGPTPVVMTL